MRRLVVIENLRRWPLELEGAEVVLARSYLVDPAYSSMRGVAVFNLCREYRYPGLGYYVSLLATARGHRPLPTVATLQDLGAGPALQVVSDELQDLIQSSLRPLRSDTFDLSVYFGRNLAKRYERLAKALFNAFPAPFIRARFTRQTRWRLSSIKPISGDDIPEGHRPFVIEQATRYFAKRSSTSPRKHLRYDLAILWSPDDPEPPSNGGAIQRFTRAARDEGLDARLIGPDDYGRLAEFDALFIRETTRLNHHTYRFARRAEAEGLVVIDDPASILACTNKVYQAEIFARHKIPTPRTLVVHEGNVNDVERSVGLPCVLKRPDSAFSLGVTKISTAAALETELTAILRGSPLVIAQAWAPSTFDWRIGVLGGRPLFACRYHMVRGHWQIASGAEGSARRYGRVEAVAFDDVPPAVLECGVRAARLIGDGLYGVDVKEVAGQALVIEVNDNPNIDAGYDDRVRKDELYREIARYFREGLDRRGLSKESA